MTKNDYDECRSYLYHYYFNKFWNPVIEENSSQKKTNRRKLCKWPFKFCQTTRPNKSFCFHNSDWANAGGGDVSTEYSVQDGTMKGSKLYVSGDQAYVKDKVNGNKLYLKCRHYKSCKGRALVIGDAGCLRQTAAHSCQSSSLDTAVIAYKNLLKNDESVQNNASYQEQY